MQVPQGGSSCSSCRFYVPSRRHHGDCTALGYAEFYATTRIPCPPDEFCSDWYEPKRRLPGC